ncbi:MAG: SIS domain-containing protein [Anaerolineae bacterium]|nr:SIS domain-containing protein [Anaerolineae bacterium]
MPTDFTRTEIQTQADAWQNALDVLHAQHNALQALWADANADSLIFTGCGSTYYLAQTAACLAQEHTGVMARGVPASELMLHPTSIYPVNSQPLLVAISRSAATTETIHAVQAFRHQYAAPVVVISCYDDRPLNLEATLKLAIPAGQEQSVAQTRSFSSMLVVAEGAATIWGRQNIQNVRLAGHEFVQQASLFAESYADPIRFTRYFYLGSGPRYGLACEAMLKMKEMSLTHAEAFHPMEFRHGPKSMVDEQTLVVGLLSETGYVEEKAVLNEMRQLGATTIELSANPSADFAIPEDQLVHYLPPLQWLAYHRAVKKALDPDHPRHLEQVVQL